MDEMGDEGVDPELEEKISTDRKQKRVEDVKVVRRGLLGTVGWEWREKEGREEKRWKRMSGGFETGVDGKLEWKEREEKIPLPEDFRLGLEERGPQMNHSGRTWNNFGNSRTPIFPGGKDGKQESRNWLASFTKSGCLNCRDEDGKVTHKSRSGDPVILVIGDEAAPTVVGHTEKGSNECTCAWVFKKEHLGLNEVAGILKKINDEKRAFDKQRGKREHEFFIPAGSKIMVASYVHLRREGLEGYMTDFNGMVCDVMSITGDIGIEVVPCVPVIFGGLDDIGRELLGGVREWLCWIAKKSGREEFVKLSKTGGREAEEWRGDEKVVFWRPSFMLMHGRQNGMDVLLTRGNTLTLIRGERTETVFKKALPASEIGRMKGSTSERDEEKRKRGDFGNGISIEGEFAFTKAVGNFCKVAVSRGRFKGNYRFNLKEQMRQRAGMGMRNVEDASMVILGGSQMGRMKDEIVELKDGLRVEKMVRMQGEWTDEGEQSSIRASYTGGLPWYHRGWWTRKFSHATWSW